MNNEYIVYQFYFILFLKSYISHDELDINVYIMCLKVIFKTKI